MTNQMSILKEVNTYHQKLFEMATRLFNLDDTSYENLVLREAHSQVLFDGLLSFGIMNRYLTGWVEDCVNESFHGLLFEQMEPLYGIL